MSRQEEDEKENTLLGTVRDAIDPFIYPLVFVAVIAAITLSNKLPDLVEGWTDAKQETVSSSKVTFKGDCGPRHPEDAQQGYAPPRGCQVFIAQ